MPQTAIAAQVHQPLDVHRDIATQVALDLESRSIISRIRPTSASVSSLTRRLGSIRDFVENLPRAVRPDTEDIGERDPTCFWLGMFTPAIRATSILSFKRNADPA